MLRLNTFERVIASPTFDFIEISTGIEEFGRKQLLSQSQVNRLQLTFEELCYQTLLPRGTSMLPMRFMASLSELDGSCVATISYAGALLDPFDELSDELSMRRLAVWCRATAIATTATIRLR